MDLGALGQLTYCTNVHAGESLEAVRENLGKYVARVKARVAPEQPFGVGLWLSAAAASELERPGERERLHGLLDEYGLYVFTLNGFPYGAFHGQQVKTRVYEPDWRDPKRLAYSNALADILASLLPPGCDGSVSTLPCGFKPAIARQEDVRELVDNLITHVGHLHTLEARTGRRVALALEPEPCCYLETIDEAIAFFEQELRGARALSRLGQLTGAGTGRAADVLQRHLGLCFDTCHAAVEFEDPGALVRKLRASEIAIEKLQLSSGLALERVDAAALAALGPYAEDVYLHQVVERRGDGALARYLDLADALAAFDAAGPREWRVHFHVPVFLERLQHFGSTQAFLREVLRLHRRHALSQQLEVETYTWDVLPEDARPLGLTEGIARELEFCLGELGVSMQGAR